jgi:hypothetical protein
MRDAAPIRAALEVLTEAINSLIEKLSGGLTKAQGRTSSTM